jgi:DNA-binding response OmpR family regulator
MRVLMVENHAVFAETVMRQFLAEHDVRLAPTLAEARLALRSGPFEVVLVDYDLDDDAKGDLLVRELIGAGFPGRIVAISARDFGNEALLEAGAHAVCPKLRFHTIGEFL